MAGIDLNRSAFNVSKIGIEIDVIIENVLRDAGLAKVGEVGDALLESVDITFFDPRGELLIDGDGPFLEDERGFIQIERVDDVEGVVESNAGIGGCGMKVNV